jgi:L-lactate dehydrogenase complex protein LldG
MNSTPKGEFLQVVRDALGKTSPSADPRSPQQTAEHSNRARQIVDLLREGRGELLTPLAETAAKLNWNVHRVTSHSQAAQRIADIVREKKATSVIHSLHPVLQRVPLASSLPGIELVAMTAEDEAGWLALKERATRADIGVTGVDYAVAETGTCVLVAGPDSSRMTSLIPPVHVAVVEPQQVLANLDELFVLLGEMFGTQQARYVNLISGPSRTGDIEQTLVIGAHGPKEAHMVIIG